MAGTVAVLVLAITMAILVIAVVAVLVLTTLVLAILGMLGRVLFGIGGGAGRPAEDGSGAGDGSEGLAHMVWSLSVKSDHAGPVPARRVYGRAGAQTALRRCCGLLLTPSLTDRPRKTCCP
jgi:hypothetical protein